MTWLLSLLMKNWHVTAMALLVSVAGLQTRRLSGVQADLATVRAEYKLERDNAEAASKEVEERSKKALETLKDEHEKQKPIIEANAVKNFLARYPLPTSLGFRLQSSDSAATSGGIAGGSGILDGATEKPMATDPGFVRDCALDAQQVIEFQRWSRLNHLNIEGE